MAESVQDESGPAFALRPGTVIGSYTIRRMLGYGGFGITYAAEHRVIGRRVAIKELYPVGRVHRDTTGSLVYSKAEAPTVAWALGKFEATTKTLCTLDHPNIVRVFDYLTANATGYMIMELLDGSTLENWLQQRSEPPSVDDLMPVVEPVMDALAYVHGQGLIHRDVAPDNILITDSGRPVLIDFGSVSRDLSDGGPQTRSGTTGQSKRGYTAPEQIRAKAKPTPEADVYSMGAVLYRALAGRAPEDGIERVLGNGPEPHEPLTTRCPPGCPMPAAQAVDKALALRPEDRFHGIAQLRDGMKAQAPPPPPPPPALPVRDDAEPRRRPKIPALAATLAYGFGGFLAGALIANAIGGIAVAAIAVVIHRVVVAVARAVPSQSEEGPAERRSQGLARLLKRPDSPPVLTASSTPERPEPATSRKKMSYGTLVAEVVIGLAVFVLSRLATQSPVGAIVAAFGAVMVFRLAIAENAPVGGESGSVEGVASRRASRLREHGRSLLIASAIAIGLLPLNWLFARETTPLAPQPVIQPAADDNNAATSDGDAAADDTSSATPAKPRARSCRHSKHGCRK